MAHDIAPLAGRYQLERLEWHDGFSAAYRAADLHLQIPATIMLLDPALSGDDAAVARFSGDAFTMARLRHPAIARIYDHSVLREPQIVAVLDASGRAVRQHYPRTCYSALEYADFGTLADFVRDVGGLLRPSNVLAVVRQVASALDYAHANGTVHRHLAPRTIYLRRGEDAAGETLYSVPHEVSLWPLLAGFSPTSELEEAEDVSFCEEDLEFSPAPEWEDKDSTPINDCQRYLAPEHFDGDFSAASDRYALGCLAFELLAGTAPYADVALPDLDMAQRSMLVPSVVQRAAARDRHLPAAVDAILARALAWKPDERYPSAAAFVQALADALDGMVPLAAGRPSQVDQDVERLHERLERLGVERALRALQRVWRVGEIRRLEKPRGVHIPVEGPRVGFAEDRSYAGLQLCFSAQVNNVDMNTMELYQTRSCMHVTVAVVERQSGDPRQDYLYITAGRRLPDASWAWGDGDSAPDIGLDNIYDLGGVAFDAPEQEVAEFIQRTVRAMRDL